MNFFGIGGLEILLITIIGVTVVGPTRLIHGIRSFRNLMTELRRQKNDLMAVLLEAVDDDFEGPQKGVPLSQDKTNPVGRKPNNEIDMHFADDKRKDYESLIFPKKTQSKERVEDEE